MEYTIVKEFLRMGKKYPLGGILRPNESNKRWTCFSSTGKSKIGRVFAPEEVANLIESGHLKSDAKEPFDKEMEHRIEEKETYPNPEVSGFFDNERFPDIHGYWEPEEKSTLRDDFAMAAMNAIIISKEWVPDMNEEYIADMAYILADAMMKRRNGED